MKNVVKTIMLALVVTGTAYSQTQPADAMMGYVKGIEGKSHQGRHDFVINSVKALNVGYFTVPFDYSRYKGRDTLNLGGEDIVVRLGSGVRRVVVGAHFDAADSTPGANDNGSGVAVLLELISTMKDYPWHCTVDFVFFDQEEKGLLGSQFYIARVVDRANHYGMINLDIVGSGDEVYVGPVGGGDDNFIMPFIRRTTYQTKFNVREKASYPSSDFESFAVMRLENISISVVPKGDSDLMAKMTRATGKVPAKDMPTISSIIGSPNDRSSNVSPASLKIAYDYTSTLLQLISESIR